MYSFKVVLTGDFGVGKSSFQECCVQGKTIITHHVDKDGDYKTFLTTLPDGSSSKLKLCDSSGVERFTAQTSTFFRGASGAILIFDLTDPHSFYNLESVWLHEIGRYIDVKGLPKILVGNKSDIKDAREVSQEEIDKFSDKHGMPYIEVSVEQNTNVKESLNILLKLMHQKRFERSHSFIGGKLCPIIHIEPLQKKIYINEQVNCFCFSGDSSKLYFGLSNGKVSIVEVETTKIVKNFTAHKKGWSNLLSNEVTCIAYSKEYKILATGSQDKQIKLWDSDTQELICRLLHSSGIVWCEFLLDLAVLLCAQKNKITMFDALFGNCINSLKFERGTLEKPKALSKDYLAFSYKSMDLHYGISIHDAKSLSHIATVDQLGMIEDLCFSPDEKYLACISRFQEVNNITIYSVPSLQQVISPKEYSQALQCCWINNYLLTGIYDGNIDVWDTINWKRSTKQLFRNGLNSKVLLSPDEKLVITSYTPNTFLLFKVHYQLIDEIQKDYSETEQVLMENVYKKLLQGLQLQKIESQMNNDIPAFLTRTDLEQQFFNNIIQPDSHMYTLIWHQVITKCKSVISSTVTADNEIRLEWTGPIDLDVVTEKLKQLVKKKSKKDNKKCSHGDTNDKLDKSQLEISGNELGAGAYGSVFLGKYYKAPVAVKKLQLDSDEKAVRNFKKEVQILKQLRHPNIIYYLGYTLTDKNEFLLVMEHMPNHSLLSWIKAHKTRKQSIVTIYNILIQICRGMHYLHSANIFHRDLKSPNILLDNAMTVKICDFGLSKTRENSFSQSGTNGTGTIPWTAPEYLSPDRKNERNERGDVYSFGVIVWELVTCNFPWQKEEFTLIDILTSVVSGERLEIPETCSKELSNIMVECWHNEPQKRPTFGNLIGVIEALLASKNGATFS